MESQLSKINETFLPHLKGEDGEELSDLEEEEEADSSKEADKKKEKESAKQTFKPIKGQFHTFLKELMDKEPKKGNSEIDDLVNKTEALEIK